MTFTDPKDSPTGKETVRVRYSIRDPGPAAKVVLHYSHGTRELTREAWAGFAAAGATIAATDPRERVMLQTALGVD